MLCFSLLLREEEEEEEEEEEAGGGRRRGVSRHGFDLSTLKWWAGTAKLEEGEEED